MDQKRYVVQFDEDDVPGDYVPFCRIEVCGNVFENVLSFLEVGKYHPFLIGQGDPFPKLWLSMKNKAGEWVQLIQGDRSIKHDDFHIEPITRHNPNDALEHGLALYAKGNSALAARITGEGSLVIDHIDLRPFKLPIYCENETLYIGDHPHKNLKLSDYEILIKAIPDVVELEGSFDGRARPSIPADVTLRLRQEAGFGCCGCGHPIIEYHHIVPWEEKKHFDPEHMMALCPNCHSKMSVMSLEDQYGMRLKPHNILRDLIEGQLVTPRKKAPEIRLGKTATFRDCRGPIIVIDEVPILEVRFDDVGRALVSLNLFDEEDNLIAAIRDNEWTAGAYASWDFLCREGYMKIRNRPKSTLLEFNLKEDVLSFKGMFWKSGNNVWVKPSKILMRRGERTIVHASQVSFIRSRGFRISRRGDGWVFGMGF